MADALARHPTANPSPLALAVSPTEAEKAKLISQSPLQRGGCDTVLASETEEVSVC